MPTTSPKFRSRRSATLKDRFEHADTVEKLFDKVPPHSVEAEMSLLGSMLLDWRVIGDVMQIVVSPDDFYMPKHQAIFQALTTLFDKHQSVDDVQVIQYLTDHEVLEKCGGAEYIISLIESVPTSDHAVYYAEIVRDKGRLRGLIHAASKILYDAYHTTEEVGQVIDSAEQSVFQIAQFSKASDPQALKELVFETFELLESRRGDSSTISGLSTGYVELDEYLSGLQKGEMVIIAARPSMGKAQPLDAKVLTTTGWKLMGELQVGDALASIDGEASRVRGIFPQREKDVFRVTLSDGRSAECCEEHLWRVMYRDWDEPRVLSTENLREMLTRRRYQNRLYVESFTGEFGIDEDLPLDPWLLGFLIGDGSLHGTSIRFSTADDQMIDQVRDAAGDAYTINHVSTYDYRLVQKGGAHQAGVQGVVPNPLTQGLRQMGLWNINSEQKFIPAGYHRASRASRVRLMQGLIDSDGWVESFGSLRFATASERLAHDVVDLMRSLGGSGTFYEKQTGYNHGGEHRAGRTSYVCNLQHADASQFATLSKKRDRLSPGRIRQRRLNIASIEFSRRAQTQCIAVTHPSQLYITNDYVVTHNTTFAMNIAENVCITNKHPVAVFSLEMGKQQLTQRILSSRSGVDSQRMRRNMLNESEFERLHDTYGELVDAPMFIDDTPGLSVTQLRAKARRLASQHDIRAIMIDYLQLMTCPGSESRQQEVSEISRGVKALARELNIPVVILSQLNRNPEGRESKRPMLSDLRESGSIEQDADVVMMIHREDYYSRQQDADYEPTNEAEIIIVKQRNGPTGIVKLHFNSSTTRFENKAWGVDAEAAY